MGDKSHGLMLYNTSVEINIPPSFVSRRTAASEVAGARHARVGVFFALSAGVFALSLLAAGGAFAYQKILAARVAKMNDDLVAVRVAFEPAFIEELRRMDVRLAAAREITSGHRAVSPVFALLERDTLATVRFTKFSFSEVQEEGLRVVLEGEAASFNAVALQSDAFSKNGTFLNPVFSDFAVDKSGTVHFSFVATLAPEFALYRSHLASAKTPPAQTPGAVSEQTAGAGAVKEPEAPPASGEVEFGSDILF